MPNGSSITNPEVSLEHTHKKFDLELSELRTKLSQMGDLVIEQLERALACLSEHDVLGTRIIIERDILVNSRDIDLEEMCLQYLALHQPVAGDLRFVTAVMKITTELDRIGDRVVDVCGAVHNRDDRDSAGSHGEISRMGVLATAMVRDSMAAFAQADTSLAKEVFQKDKEFDALYCDVFSKLITSAKDPTKLRTMPSWRFCRKI
jgi:phosphate transport system protein